MASSLVSIFFNGFFNPDADDSSWLGGGDGEVQVLVVEGDTGFRDVSEV